MAGTQDETTKKFTKTHGGSRTPEYKAWTALRGRCNNPKDARYADYGGRGISVCPRWDFFTNFLADVGPRPGPGYSIDRVDNNGDYCPGNCRWATIVEQNRNQRNHKLNPEKVVLIREMHRQGMTFSEIAKQFGVAGVSIAKVVKGLLWADVP